MKAFLLLFLFLSATVAASAHPIPPMVGTYSDLKSIESEGDVTGTEITIIPSGSEGSYAYHALVQNAEGVPNAPQLVPAKIDGATVSFSFPFSGAGLVTFAGKISGNNMVGKVSGEHFSEVELSLPRKAGYGQSPSDK
jgi:hypothetical protein